NEIRNAVLEEIALAEIADRGAADPGEELHGERAIEAVGLAHGLDVGLRRLRPGDRDCQIAREPGQHERQRHYGEGYQDAHRETPDNETQHVRFPRTRNCSAVSGPSTAPTPRNRNGVIK